MEDLIKALVIFSKYTHTNNPTICEHDELMIVGVDATDVSDEDHNELDRLGFFWSESDEIYKSFRFGSA